MIALARLPLWVYLAAALALSLAGNWLLWQSSSNAREAARMANAQVDDAVAANESQTAVVADLQTRLTTCVGQADMIQSLADQAIADLEAARTERHRAESARRQQLTRLYESDPDCAAWAAGAVCAGVSDSL